ncbi:DUF3794 domain-containing protein [Clostridium sp. 19966]|uniref:DUF3794 and LysM peptidoglycan-binding domain-containing protein n=1 Tax=Clostridium sp. 19966 TaxID=2768166 RepID=UPI0028DF4F34|nr:SPOCS domain-containing protein [Clostridium sp. 19966]MDT8715618.1 DUF3794 domain-containing protein [Clostridium sp. 19966]
MAAFDLIKESIEYEQLLEENFTDTMVKGEYLIPDTHPDVAEILMVEVKPYIVTRETMQDKVYVEGQIFYNVIYLAKEEETMGVYNVTYTDKFSNYVDIKGAEHKMLCESECYIEHMDSNIINERKVGISGIIKLKSAVYKNYEFEIVKGIGRDDEIQLLKHEALVDKLLGSSTDEIIMKTQLLVPESKPKIGNVIKCDIRLHKKDVRIMESRAQLSAFAFVNVLYRAEESQELVLLSDDVFISKEVEIYGIDSSMYASYDFQVDKSEYSIKQDDFGENKIVDIESIVNTNLKVLYKESVDMIEDAYSPRIMMNMVRQNYNLNVMKGAAKVEVIVKDNIDASRNSPALEVIMTDGDVVITDKKLVENKIVIDGIVNVNVLYKTNASDKTVAQVTEELPFNCSADIEGVKIDMESFAKANLESIEASIEAGTIAVKALVTVDAKAHYIENKDFLVDIVESEDEIPAKKASITIYIVQPGDSLWKIAKKYCTTIDEIVRMNGVENPDKVYPGEKLLIPGRAVV